MNRDEIEKRLAARWHALHGHRRHEFTPQQQAARAKLQRELVIPPDLKLLAEAVRRAFR